MAEKFKQKYRIASARHPAWDYSNQAAYFVTVCTKNREHFFGKIVNNQMELSEIGRIVEQEWRTTPNIRPDMNLSLGEFVVMPNHFHGILMIGENEFNNGSRDAMHRVSTGTTINKFGAQSKNLSSILRGFKSAVTKNARLIEPVFAWQARFHDHIIRNEKSFQNISTYIRCNAERWIEDKFNNPFT